MRLAFIGGGTMAEAILGGVLAADLAQPGDVAIGEPIPSAATISLSDTESIPTRIMSKRRRMPTWW